MTSPLLTVEGLRVSFPTRTRVVEAVRGIGFTVGREKVGLVGESGSGKSMTGRAIVGLVPPPGKVTAGRLMLGDVDVLRASARKMREVRGRRVSMVLQDPRFSLNPVLTVGAQIAESYRAHERVPRAKARDRALEMLRAVRIRGRLTRTTLNTTVKLTARRGGGGAAVRRTSRRVPERVPICT